MGTTLLWIESLAASLLFIAAAVAVSARLRQKPSVIVLGLSIALPLMIGLAQTSESYVLKSYKLENNWLGYTLSWTVALIVGMVVILRTGLKRIDDVRRASNWPRMQLGIGAVAAIALHLITFWNLDSNVRLRLSSVRMEAGSMALAAAPPRVPDQDNAALVYEHAFDVEQRLYKTLTERRINTDAWWSKFTKPDFNTADPELREYLKQIQPTLNQVRRAAAMPGCYFEREYAQPSLDMPLPELSHMRQLARILAVDARVKAADGKVREALANIAAMRRISQHVTAEPILISGLVAVAIDTITCDTLQPILATSSPNADDLAVLPREDNFTNRRALRRCLTGEEAFGLSAFTMLASDEGSETFLRVTELNPNTVLPLIGPYWRVFLLTDDLAAYRAQMKTLRSFTNRPLNSALNELDTMEKESAIHRTGPVSGMLLPALSRCFKAFLNDEAQHRLSDLALAATAYRIKNGKYPEKIEDLIPEFANEIPIDPFDSKPLRMVASNGGVTLYSIGKDLKDGGGTTHDYENGDILFRLGPTAEPAKKTGGL